MGDFDSKVLPLLKARNRPMSLKSIMDNLGVDLDIDQDSLQSMLDSCNSMVKVSGTYRYRQPSMSDYSDVCDIIKISLDGTYIDARVEYDKHSDEYGRLDIRSPFELAFFLSRYFPDSTTTMGLSFKTEAILGHIQKPVVGAAGGSSDYEAILGVFSKLSSDYISLDDLYLSYKESCDGRKLSKTEVEAVLNSMSTVLKRHGKYRLLSVDSDTLRALMVNAADSIPFERADCGMIYHTVIVEAKSMDIRDSDELYQVLKAIMPGSISSMVGEIKLSHFRECTIKDGDSFDDNDSHMDLDVEDYVKAVEMDAGSMDKTPDSTTIDSNQRFDAVQQTSDDMIQTYSQESLSGLVVPTDNADVVESTKGATAGPESISTMVDVVNSILDGSGYISTVSLMRKMKSEGFQITREEMDVVISCIQDQHILFSHGKSYRLHRLISEESVDRILGKYHECVYSVYQLFSENEAEFRALDITGWDELVQYLVEDGSLTLIEGSMMLVSFDGIAVEDQVRTFIRDNPNVDDRYILRTMYSKYGIPTRVVKSVLPNLASERSPRSESEDERSDDPYHSEDQFMFDEYAVELLKGKIQQDCYTTDEFISTVSDIIPTFTGSDVNKLCLKQIGYSIRHTYVYKESFKSPGDAYRSMFSGSRIVSLNKFQTECGLAPRVIQDMLDSRDLLRFDDGQYIPVSRLELLDITKGDVLMFPKTVVDSMSGRTFTIRYLRGNGLCGAMDNPSLGDAFLQDCLVSSGLFRSITMDGVALMNSDHAPTLGDILEDIVSSEGSMDLDDIQQILKDEYNLEKDGKSLKRSIGSTDMIYLEKIDKVFRNREEMRRFLNG